MEQASKPREVEIVKSLLESRGSMLEIRNHMRLMGEAAGIPVGFFFMVRCLFSTFVCLSVSIILDMHKNICVHLIFYLF